MSYCPALLAELGLIQVERLKVRHQVSTTEESFRRIGAVAYPLAGGASHQPLAGSRAAQMPLRVLDLAHLHAPAAGSSNQNVAPWPGVLSNPTRPPWAATSALTTARPIPEPRARLRPATPDPR